MAAAGWGVAALSMSRPATLQTNTAKFRVAIIGRTGKGDYGHGLDVVWHEIEQADVVAVADPDPQGRAAAAERTGAPRAYSDYRQMLEKERPQIVSVAPAKSPPSIRPWAGQAILAWQIGFVFAAAQPAFSALTLFRKSN